MADLLSSSENFRHRHQIQRTKQTRDDNIFPLSLNIKNRKVKCSTLLTHPLTPTSFQPSQYRQTDQKFIFTTHFLQFGVTSSWSLCMALGLMDRSYTFAYDFDLRNHLYGNFHSQSLTEVILHLFHHTHFFPNQRERQYTTDYHCYIKPLLFFLPI